MAVCDVHGSVAAQKTASMYVTIVKDGNRFKRRLKQCADCVSDLRATYAKQWSDGFVMTRFNHDTVCNSCGEVRGEDGTLHPLYATGYSTGDKRFDYFAAYCELCADSVISHLRLDRDTRNGA